MNNQMWVKERHDRLRRGNSSLPNYAYAVEPAPGRKWLATLLLSDGTVFKGTASSKAGAREAAAGSARETLGGGESAPPEPRAPRRYPALVGNRVVGLLVALRGRTEGLSADQIAATRRKLSEQESFEIGEALLDSEHAADVMRILEGIVAMKV